MLGRIGSLMIRSDGYTAVFMALFLVGVALVAAVSWVGFTGVQLVGVLLLIALGVLVWREKRR
ncbi:MAG: hypothetical protein ACTJHU_00310 [Mycetocola sp.]